MTLPEKIKKYGLTQKDWFQHKHYTIITRTGIDKIQAYEKITITYKAVKVDAEFCVVQAFAIKDSLMIESFGSAKYGEKEWLKFDKPNQFGKTGKWMEHGNTGSWYVMEMAEKRAMSRVVLKITGFYELGVFGEDESEDFKPQQEDRNPAITNEQYNKCFDATKEQIQTVLNKFRMTPQQRTELKGLL